MWHKAKQKLEGRDHKKKYPEIFAKFCLSMVTERAVQSDASLLLL